MDQLYLEPTDNEIVLYADGPLVHLNDHPQLVLIENPPESAEETTDQAFRTK